jgi:hypothetical protein
MTFSISLRDDQRAISARRVGPEEHLSYQRFNTENDEILTLPALFETVMKELM